MAYFELMCYGHSISSPSLILPTNTTLVILSQLLTLTVRHIIFNQTKLTAEEFNALPVAAYLLNPSLAPVVMGLNLAALLHAANTYIIQECGCLLTRAYMYQLTETTQRRLPP